MGWPCRQRLAAFALGLFCAGAAWTMLPRSAAFVDLQEHGTTPKPVRIGAGWRTDIPSRADLESIRSVTPEEKTRNTPSHADPESTSFVASEEETMLMHIEANSQRKIQERFDMLFNSSNRFSKQWAEYDAHKSADAWSLFTPYDVCPWTLEKNPGFGILEDGGKWICGLQELHNSRGNGRCIVYSIGSRGNFNFEARVKKIAPSCEVHTFDPTFDPRQVQGRQIPGERDSYMGLPPGVNGPLPLEFASGIYDAYHLFGVGPQNSECGLKLTGKNVLGKAFPKCLETQTVEEMMRRLGHDHIDILKMDVDGGEWHKGNLIDMPYDRIGEFLLEVHPGYGGPKTASALHVALSQLEAKGLRLYSLEPVWSKAKHQVESAWRNFRWRPHLGAGSFI